MPVDFNGAGVGGGGGDITKNPGLGTKRSHESIINASGSTT